VEQVTEEDKKVAGDEKDRNKTKCWTVFWDGAQHKLTDVSKVPTVSTALMLDSVSTSETSASFYESTSRSDRRQLSFTCRLANLNSQNQMLDCFLG
jgi:hypothetical protein